MVILKYRSRRSLAIGKRDTYGLKSLERTKIKKIINNINALCTLYGFLRNSKHMKQADVVQCVIINEYK